MRMTEISQFQFLTSDGGVTGALFRTVNWDTHPMGPVKDWPSALKISLGILFASRQPMFIFWGDEHFQFYNDAYLPSFGVGKHPDAMGQRGEDCWPEIWPTIYPQIYQALTDGKGTWFENQLLPIFRNGSLEDVYWTYGYSPIANEVGQIGGVIVLCIETTSSVKAMSETKASQKDLLDFFMQAPVPMVILDGPDHIVSLANPPYEKFVGRTVVGKTLKEAFPSGEADSFIPIIANVYNTGAPFMGKELPVQLPDNGGVFQTYWLDVGYHPFRDQNGAIRGVFAIVHDVSAQVIAREEVRKSAEILEAIMITSPDLIYVKDRHGRMVYCNPTTLRLIGRPAGSVYGKTDLEFLENEQSARSVMATDERIMSTGKGEMAEETITWHDGRTRFYFSRKEPQYDHNDRIIGLIGISTDHTELRQAQRRLLTVFDTLPIFAGLLDNEGRISAVNQIAADAVERPKMNLVGRFFWDCEWWNTLTDVQARVKNAFSKAQSGLAQKFDTEYTAVEAGVRKIRHVALSMIPTFNDVGAVQDIVATGFDITERMIQEKLILQAKEEAEKANSLKSAFLANMSHEIRTPLGAIMGFVNLIKDENLSRSSLENYVSVIDRNSSQLLRIIDDILDLSKVEAGMIQLENIEFSLRELLADFASLMGFRAREKGISFDMRITTPLPRIVSADPTRIRQILSNVVGNAIKFTEKGRVALSVSYTDGFLRFEVKDTGRGITPEQERVLFQPFSQADASVTRKFGGTGLGLVLTRRLAEVLGGDFRLLESQQGVGSTFVARVQVSVKPGVSMTSITEVNPSFSTSPTYVGLLQGQRILLVEDSPDNQALVSIILKKSGALVDLASDGAEGVETALRGNYDVVLMDVQMPVMDGITAVKRLSEMSYQKPVIALTAHAMKEERDRCLAAGFSDFLSKPVQREALFSLLTNLNAYELT